MEVIVDVIGDLELGWVVLVCCLVAWDWYIARLWGATLCWIKGLFPGCVNMKCCR